MPSLVLLAIQPQSKDRGFILFYDPRRNHSNEQSREQSRIHHCDQLLDDQQRTKAIFQDQTRRAFYSLPRLFQIACDCVLVSLDVGHEKDHDL